MGQAIISSVNSVCHMYGSRAFNTPEGSTNNWLIAIPALGEGWHNNHHAFQTSAFLGLRWWEFDPGGIFVATLAATGLIWDVKCPDRQRIEAKRCQLAAVSSGIAMRREPVMTEAPAQELAPAQIEAECITSSDPLKST